LVAFAVGTSLPLALPQNVSATENVPHAPFAEWADLPAPGQLVVGLFYDESESYHIWANGGQRYNVDNLKTESTTALMSTRVISRFNTASPKNGRRI
jgi:hypothetical protein